MPGRPQVKFEFNLNNIDACFEEVFALMRPQKSKFSLYHQN